MPRSTISSSERSSNVVPRISAGDSPYPAVISSIAFTTRRGVSRSPSRCGSSPITRDSVSTARSPSAVVALICSRCARASMSKDHSAEAAIGDRLKRFGRGRHYPVSIEREDSIMASNALDISKLEDSAAGRALEIWTKAPLTNFVDFTSTLVKGVFDTLIETEMQQTQNYTALVASIAGTLADFEVKTFGDVNVATVNYINEVILPTYGGTPSPFTQPASTATTLTTFTTKDVEQVYAGVSATIGTAEKTFALDANNAILDVELFELTKALLKKQARRTWDDLRALVAAGVTHVDIEDGEIATSLTFHTDSVDSASRDVSNTTTTFANKS